MPLWDRLLRSLFVAAAVGLGWGIRGKYGHSLGAMVPGASLGMALAYVSGQRNAMKWMPILAGVGAFFISIGGLMSYGLLHGYAQADTFRNFAYGLFTLFLEGGAWGGFCGAAIGLLLERERVTVGEVVSLLASAFAGGWLFYFLVVDLAGFHINPGRNDITINFVGQILAIFAWMALNKRSMGLRGLSLGVMGWGIGMSLGRLIGNAMQNAPFETAAWTWMETSCGFIGGFVFAFGMLGRQFDNLPDERGWRQTSVWAIVYVMAFIPLLHLLTRTIPEERSDSWTKFLKKFDITDAIQIQQISAATMEAMTAVCVAAIVAAAAWYFLWKKNHTRWGWFPVLAFNLLMLTYLSLNTFYVQELKHPQPNTLNIHHVFWEMLAFMAVFALAFETFWPRRETVVDDAAFERLPTLRWAASTLLVFAATVGGAFFTNGPKTMRGAETRWPLWSWRDELPKPAKSDPAPLSKGNAKNKSAPVRKADR